MGLAVVAPSPEEGAVPAADAWGGPGSVNASEAGQWCTGQRAGAVQGRRRQPLVCVVHHDDLLAAVHVGRSSTAWRISCLSPSRALGSRHRRERVEERGRIRAGSLALVVMLDRARSGVFWNGFNWA
jgi:hypothetical protein